MNKNYINMTDEQIEARELFLIQESIEDMFDRHNEILNKM